MPPAVYRDMQYDNDGVCHNKRNGGKLHGNISRNGYGNAIIGRYGGCFEEGIWWVYDTGERCAVFREASNGGRKKSAYNPWTQH